MFIQIIQPIPVDNPPPVGAILWARPSGGMWETEFHNTTYKFWDREVIRVNDLVVQMAVAEITHHMIPIHGSMFDVVADFQNRESPAWQTYSEAIQQHKTVSQALCEALIIKDDGDDERFDAVFYLVPKKGEPDAPQD